MCERFYMSLDGQDTSVQPSEPNEGYDAIREQLVDWLARAIVRRLLEEQRQHPATTTETEGRTRA